VADLVHFGRIFQVWNERRPPASQAGADQHYLSCLPRVWSLAERRSSKIESAESNSYAGMAEASAGRLYGLRARIANTARSGVRGREHLLRAKALDS